MNQNSELLAFMEAGVAAHNGGDLENAEVNYRKALAIDPHNPDALHLLGYLAFQLGFPDEAISLIEDAIEINPDQPLFFNNLATVYLAKDVEDKAIEAYRQSLEIKDDDPDVLNDLGNLIRQSKGITTGNNFLEQAEHFVRKAITLNPQKAQYHNNLGNVIRDKGSEHYDEARACYNRAQELDPGLVGVTSNLGLLARMDGDFVLAERLFRQAIEQAPDDAEPHNNLAQLLQKIQKIGEAIQFYTKAEQLDPNNYAIGLNKARCLMLVRHDDEALQVLQRLMKLDISNFKAYWIFAITLRKTGDLDAAESFTRSALDHFPGNMNLRHELASIYVTRCEFPKAEKILLEIIGEVKEGDVLAGGGGIYSTLGSIYLDTGDFEQVKQNFAIALEMEPDNQNALINYSQCLFAMGNLEEGWKMYKDRWKSEEFSSPIRPYQKPMWEGQPLEGKTLAVWGEQGIGDEIRYASLVPDIMKKGGKVVIECAPRLVDLFTRSFEGATVIARQDDLSVPFEDTCDYQTPIVDLGGHFRPTLNSFPQERYAYLKADPGRVEFWRGRLAEISPRPKVGILWRSMHANVERMPHYASIEELEPIWNIQGVDFVNLMYAECSEDRARVAEKYGVEVHTWDDIDLKDDQDDLAALITAVDLVVAPQTATGYLAAALDVPVLNFCTTKFAAEAFGDRDAPGWAPAMKYVSKTYGEPWGPVMDDIAGRIKGMFGLG